MTRVDDNWNLHALFSSVLANCRAYVLDTGKGETPVWRNYEIIDAVDTLQTILKKKNNVQAHHCQTIINNKL